MRKHNVFNDQEDEMREKDDEGFVVRSWAQAQYLVNVKGEVIGENPNYHPRISQREDGSYCYDNGRKLRKSQVPSYILDQGMPPPNTPYRRKRRQSFEQAMLGAGVKREKYTPGEQFAPEEGAPTKVRMKR